MEKIKNIPNRFHTIFAAAIFAVLIPLTSLADIQLNTGSDDFNGAIDISSISTTLPVSVTGNNIGATFESGESVHTDDTNPLAPGKKSIWWKWTPNFSGTVTLSTAGSGTTEGGADPFVNTQVGVYTGGSIDASVATLIPLVKKEDSNGVLGHGWTQVSFEVVADSVYKIAVDGYMGSTGNIKLTLSTSTVTPPADHFSLVVNVSPIGGGTVEVSPAQPTDSYSSNTVVTLSTPATDFQGWTGSANGIATNLSLTMNAPKTITAHFGSTEAQILFGHSNGQKAVWFLNGTNFNGAAYLQSTAPGWRIVGTSDLNNDGQKDFIWQSTDGRIAYWLMNGNRFVSSGIIGNVVTSWRASGISDFDGDGKADIVFHNIDGRLAIWFLNGTTFRSSALLRGGQPTGLGWRVVGASDLNNDSKGDILFQNTDGRIAVWYMNGTIVFNTAIIASVQPSWRFVGLGDFNNDGKVDFLWQNSDRRLAVWFMNGVNIVESNFLNNDAGPLALGWQVFAVK